MVFRVLIWLMTGIRPRQWVAVHRKHHAFTDVPGTRTRPSCSGFWQVQLANAALYRKVRPRRRARRSATPRTCRRTGSTRLLFDHAFSGSASASASRASSSAGRSGLIAAGVHAVIYLALNAAVNAVGHSFGTKIYDNTALNNQWLALVDRRARASTTTTTPPRPRPSSRSAATSSTRPGG